MAALQVEGVEGEEHACRESRGPGWRGQVAGDSQGQPRLSSDMASQPFTVALGNLYHGCGSSVLHKGLPSEGWVLD